MKLKNKHMTVFQANQPIFSSGIVVWLFFLNQGQLKQPSPIQPATLPLFARPMNQHSFPK
jgi:hypothetical protein